MPVIDVYMWTTTNSRRATVTLEEAGLDYVAHATNIHEGAQRTPEHTARNPYQKVPVIVDSDGPGGKPVTVFESGAIQLYVAEKSGKLYGKDAAERVEVQKWFILAMNSALPLLSMLRDCPGLRDGADRVCKVIDDRLGGSEFLAPSFSIADLALFPRVYTYDANALPVRDYKNIARWIDQVAERPGVKAGWAQPPIEK